MANRTKSQSYTAVFKLKVVEFAETNSYRSPEREFMSVRSKYEIGKRRKLNYNLYPFHVDRSEAILAQIGRQAQTCQGQDHQMLVIAIVMSGPIHRLSLHVV